MLWRARTSDPVSGGWLVLGAMAQEVRYVLLIGNKEYPAEFGRLSLPHEDVPRMKGTFLQAGFLADNITVLNDATQTETNLAHRLLLKACDGGLDRACREIRNGQ